MKTWRLRDTDGNLTGPSKIADAPPDTEGDWVELPDVGPGQRLEEMPDGTFAAVDAPTAISNMSLSQVKSFYIAVITEGYGRYIVTRTLGSNALGSFHFYEFSKGFYDAFVLWHLMAARTTGRQSRKIPCRLEGESLSTFRVHTENQAKTLLKDVANDELEKQDEAETLINGIVSAPDKDTLESLPWPEWLSKP